MKQVFTYILLLSLLVRPLFIVSHIAYYELNIEYITEKFCVNKEKPELKCNGKCHLAKELQVVSASSNLDIDKDVQVSAAYKLFAPVFYSQLKSNYFLNLKKEFYKNKANFSYKNGYSYSLEYSLLRPPIV